MRDYLTSRAALIDFAGESAIGDDWYADMDHIDKQYAQDWTKLFHRTLMERGVLD